MRSFSLSRSSCRAHAPSTRRSPATDGRFLPGSILWNILDLVRDLHSSLDPNKVAAVLRDGLSRVIPHEEHLLDIRPLGNASALLCEGAQSCGPPCLLVPDAGASDEPVARDEDIAPLNELDRRWRDGAEGPGRAFVLKTGGRLGDAAEYEVILWRGRSSAPFGERDERAMRLVTLHWETAMKNAMAAAERMRLRESFEKILGFSEKTILAADSDGAVVYASPQARPLIGGEARPFAHASGFSSAQRLPAWLVEAARKAEARGLAAAAKVPPPDFRGKPVFVRTSFLGGERGLRLIEVLCGADARPSATAFSPRERQVIEAVAAGLRNREIAGRLAVGAETVRKTLSRVFSKSGLASRAELAAVAGRRGGAEVWGRGIEVESARGGCGSMKGIDL